MLLAAWEAGMKNALLCVAVVVLSCGFVLGQQYKVLYSFAGVPDGNQPYFSGVVFDATGNLYGTTEAGGTGPCINEGVIAGCGTVFELSPNQDGTWSETIVHSFLGEANGDGETPYHGVVLDNAGNLYGATLLGGGSDKCGQDGCGSIFELSPSNNGWTETILYRFKGGPEGSRPTLWRIDIRRGRKSLRLRVSGRIWVERLQTDER
jgi:hypothetical protein